MRVGRAEANDNHEDGDKSRRHLLLTFTHPKDFVNLSIGSRSYAPEKPGDKSYAYNCAATVKRR